MGYNASPTGGAVSTSVDLQSVYTGGERYAVKSVHNKHKKGPFNSKGGVNKKEPG
jgi:hypothetical protein